MQNDDSTFTGDKPKLELVAPHLEKIAEGTPGVEKMDDATDQVVLPKWDGDLGGLLADIARLFERFLVIDKDAIVFLALWVAHTHVFEAAEVTPYAGITSPTRRCGKSTLLRILTQLVRNPDYLVNPTDSVVFRCFDDHDGVPTLILDEADRTFKSPKDRGDLIAMVNAGFEEGATIPRTEGTSPNFKVRRFPVFCPKAFGSIGDIPDDATLDRTVVVRMARKGRGDKVERARRKILRSATEPVRLRLFSWAFSGAADKLLDAEPALPEELDDRAQDMWEPLFAVADLAGGKWPRRAREAALVLCAGRDLDDDSADVDLLRRCFAAFTLDNGAQLDAITTVDLIASICTRDDDSRFRSWWWDDREHKPNSKAARQLGVRLRKFGIHPEKEKLTIDGERARGYLRRSFENAWGSYEIGTGPNNPGNPGNPGASARNPSIHADLPSAQVRDTTRALPGSADATRADENGLNKPKTEPAPGSPGLPGLSDGGAPCGRHAEEEPKSWCHDCQRAGWVSV